MPRITLGKRLANAHDRGKPLRQGRARFSTDEEIVLTVRHCTAWHHVAKLVGTPSPHFCDQTIRTNEALAEGSPYAIDTEITGPGSCRQVIRRHA